MAAPMEHDETEEIDNFKHVYKRFKRRDRPLNVDGVIDFSSNTIGSEKYVETFRLHDPELSKFPGLKPIKDWKAYQLKHCKGFIVIPNPFEPKYQRYWIQRCLLDFPKKPNRTNVDAHMDRPSQIWHTCLNGDKPDLKKDSLLMKLRWATLGYQYEWNTKEYFSDRVQVFPDDLKHICAYIAAALGYSDYSSEAGIVNYYRMDSSLMGHTDVSELDKAAPLISFSFGQSCIFLIGGPTKETEPIPLFLHSGDICLMTGPARLSYHAVPRILSADTQYIRSCFYGHTQVNGEMRSRTDSDIEKSKDKIDMETVIDANISVDEEENIEEDEDPYSDPKPKLGGSANHLPDLKNSEQSNEIKIIDSFKEDETIIVTPTAKGNKCSVSELDALMNKVVDDTDWMPFDMYLNTSRVNVNVRQVLKSGSYLKPSPETIVPCQGKTK